MPPRVVPPPRVDLYPIPREHLSPTRMVPPPRVDTSPILREHPSPVHEPVAHRTRSYTVSPMTAASRRYPGAFLTYWFLSVLDSTTGQYIKHLQLRHHPKLGPVWDASYSNELGRLCQGAGKGPTSTGQRTKGTDTFHVIRFKNIQLNQQKGITFTKAV